MASSRLSRKLHKRLEHNLSLIDVIVAKLTTAKLIPYEVSPILMRLF